MKPIKKKGLYYFILQEDSSKFNFGDESVAYKQSLLNQLMEGDLPAIIDFFRPMGMYCYNVASDISHRMVDARHFQTGFKVKSIEEVISLTPYQNSVKFTIGSSIKKKEDKKYLIGIEIAMDHLNKQFESECKNKPWYKLSFDDIENVGAMKPIIRDFHHSDYNKGIGFSEMIINSKFLGHAGNSNDVHRYSFDDNFKYYTLLCN